MLTLSQYLAREITKGTSKKFSGLQSAYFSYQKENNMATPTSETLNGGSTFTPTQTTAEPNVAAEGVKPLAGTPGTDSTMSGMNVGGSQVSPLGVRNVDARTISGSHAGSVPAPNTGAGITDFAKNSPGPREAVGQFPLSGKQAPASTPASFLGAESSDQN